MASLTPKEEEDLRIPRTAVNKLIKDFIPDIRVSNDAREFITECCNVFVHRLTREANTICEGQQKKTMSHEHVLSALDKVGLTPYRDQVQAVMQEVISKKHRQSTRLEHLGLSEDELYRRQQELFHQARQEQQLMDEEEWVAIQKTAPISAPIDPQSTSHNNPNSYDDEDDY